MISISLSSCNPAVFRSAYAHSLNNQSRRADHYTAARRVRSRPQRAPDRSARDEPALNLSGAGAEIPIKRRGNVEELPEGRLKPLKCEGRAPVAGPRHARQGKVQVSVKALGPARRKTRRSVLWPGSTATSTPARNPRIWALGVRNVRRIRPVDAVATVSTSEGSLM